MKRVHSPDMVAHIWANKGQDDARNAGGNFYFTGPVLYSYGSHFVIAAHLENGRILWNDASYSNSTARHKSHAWRALSRTQSENRLHVPALNYDQFRDLQRLQDSGNGRTLPQLAQHCADGIIDAVSAMAKQRYGAGPMMAAFRQCQSLQKTADQLCAYVTKGKRAPAWPVPRLPDELPAREEMPAFIRSIAKSRMITCHAGAIAESRRLLDALARIVDAGPDAGWQIQNIRGTVDSIGRKLTNADTWHVSAHARKSAAVRKLRAELAAIEPAALALVDQWQTLQARAEIRMLSRDIAKHMQSRRGAHAMSRSRRDSGYFANKLRDAVRNLPESERAAHALMLARVERCNAWDFACNALGSARSAIDVADSYGIAHPGDSLRHYTDAANHAARCPQHPAFMRRHGAEVLRLANLAHERAEALRAALAAKHARAVDDWKAGVIARLPYEAGTFARIDGAQVVTSRGAIVPITHACRLARIARRVIAAGGKAWPDGSGPMVGQFRVHSIGADGSAVIGCHEFDAAEGTRLLALLESCADCATVTESVESCA
jgi:hypothetical protein